MSNPNEIEVPKEIENLEIVIKRYEKVIKKLEIDKEKHRKRNRHRKRIRRIRNRKNR